MTPSPKSARHYVIEIPRCWTLLIDEVFPEDLAGIKDGDTFGQVIAVDDPQPYYDDCRSVTITLNPLRTFSLCLSSGQGNYWGSYNFYDPESDTARESEPFESFIGPIEDHFLGIDYCIDIKVV